MNRIFKKLWKLLAMFLGTNHVDELIPIRPAPYTGKERIASPELIKVSEELGLGVDRERLVEMAVRNHITVANQINWLKAIPVLRQGKKKWVLDTFIPKNMSPTY